MFTTPNDSDRPSHRRAVALARESYVSESMLFHMANSRSPKQRRQLLAMLESRNFLARQAERPDGFELGAQQLERYVLPATVRLGDWDRFFRYLLTAATLRDLARTLDDPTILQALARSGRLALAEALVGRLADPADRARGWAVLAAVPSPAEPEFQRLVTALQAELDGIAETPSTVDSVDLVGDEALRRRSEALASAGRLLAPRLRARWTGWIAPLDACPELADRVRSAVVKGFFDAGHADADEPWTLLAEVRDSEVLVRLLPGLLARAAAAEPGGDPLHWLDVVRARLPQTEADPRIPWSVGLALLGGLDQGAADAAAEWRRLRDRLRNRLRAGPGGAAAAPWDRKLLEQGSALWPRLTDDQLRELESELDHPSSTAHLRVLVAEGRRDPGSFRQALTILLEVPDGVERLSLYLRTLGSLRGAAGPPAREIRSRVKALLVHLAEIQYAVAPEDLCRALDLVARYLPRRLRRTVDGALAAPGSSASTLRSLAGLGEEKRLLEELLTRAETYAAMAAANAAEGFELRAQVLIRLACRLLGQGAEPDPLLTGVADRLLPEEEDRLRAEAARAVAAERPELAEGLCSGIRDRRLRLRTRLEVLPPGAGRSEEGDLVAPENLYRAAVRFDAVEDELWTLGGLLQEPEEPAALARTLFEEVRSPGRRIEALAALARHGLRHQERRRRPGPRDRLAAVLPLKESLGVVESDPWLLALTPELVSIGSHLGAREAVAELQEAFERVAEMDSVPWDRRERVLIELLGRIEPLFFSDEPAEPVDAPLAHVPRTERARRAAELVIWLARLPLRIEGRPAGRHLRERWHRLLPVLTAIGERVERRLPRRGSLRRVLDGLGSLRAGPAAALEDSARRGREWSPEHREVFELCLASPEERRERLRERLGATRRLDGGNGPVEPETAPSWTLSLIRSWAWLLAGGEEEPAIGTALLARLDPGPGRDRTVLELVRSAPISGGTASELVGLLPAEDGAVRSEWTVRLGLRFPEEVAETDWLAAVADLVARDRLDPADPATLPVRRKLWTTGSDRAAAELGDAALRALATGGGAGGQRAARWFLGACVKPRLGEAAPAEAHRRWERMRRALERARTLRTKDDPGGEPPDGAEGRTPRDDGDEPAPEEPSAAKGRLARFRRWTGTWARRPLRPDEAPFHEARSLALLTGFLALPVLPHFQGILFGWEAPRAGPEAVSWGVVALVILSAVHGLLVGSYLAWSTSADRTVHRPIRWLRTVLAAVPLFGLWTVPVWKWLLSRREGWVRRAPEPAPSVGTGRRILRGLQPRRFAERLGGWAGRPSVFVGLFLVDLVTLTVTLRVLSGAEGFHRPMVWMAGGVQLLFWVVMLGGLVWWVRSRRLTGWPAVALLSLSACWLLPVPALPLLGMVGMIALDSATSVQTLSDRAFDQGRGVGRLPSWLGSEERLRKGWGALGWASRLRGLPESVRPAPEATGVERRLLWFFQGKGAALFFEAAWLAGGFGGLLSVPAGLITGLQWIFLAVGVFALAGLAVAFVREIVVPDAGRRVFGSRLFWGHLAGTQVAMALGLELGAGLAGGDLPRAAGALVLLGLGGAILQVGSIFVGFLLRSVPERSWETRFEMVAKMVVYAGAGLLGDGLLDQRAEVLELVPVLEAFRTAAPLFGFILGIGGLRWLGSPPRWLALAAVAPFGGLAIPWWIRRRQAGREAAQPEGRRSSGSSRPATSSSLPSR